MSSTVRDFAVAFVPATLTFLLLDAAWLSTMASPLYRPAIGHVMREDFDVLAAAIFYLLYLIGVVIFVVRASADAFIALARGALFGLVCYGTFGLTNQAVIVGWPWHLTLIDLAWGACVTALSAGVAHRVARAWRR